MKKTLLSIAFAFMGMAAMAQNIIFVDKDGKEIPNGSTVTVTEIEEDEFMGNIMHSGLYVKYNGTGNGAYAGMTVDIQRIDNGSVQHCFPGNCFFWSNVGVRELTSADALTPGTKKDIQSEWMPSDKGTCIVAYTVREMERGAGTSFNEVSKCSTVTVKYVYDDTKVSGIAGSANDARCYNLQGQPVGKNYKGVVICKGKKVVK